MVRRASGLRVLLTKEALDVFTAERDREAREKAWTTERRRWLSLARTVSASEQKISRLDAAKPSAESVAGARTLYLTALEPAVRAAKRAKRWVEIARIRKDQAAALYRAAGSPMPPAEDILALHAAWSTAALKAASVVGTDAELVSSGCCSICNKDDGKAFRIAAELRTPRLPHAGCPKGLCACDWYPLPDSKTPRRGRKRSASATSKPVEGGAATLVPSAAPDAVPDAVPESADESQPRRYKSLVERISRP